VPVTTLAIVRIAGDPSLAGAQHYRQVDPVR
jgi:hypothetical protein